MLRDNLVGLIEPMRISAGVDPLALSIQKQASDDRSSCLENPRPEGAESSLTENVTSPFQAEPAHFFGYGNFVSGNAVLGFRAGHHWEFAGQPVQDLRRVEQYRNSSNAKRASCRVPQELTRRTEAELCETLFEQNWIRDAQREIPNCRTGDRALSHCERLGVVANVASAR